jgi:thiol-disulfide isomerase/thioredoxin
MRLHNIAAALISVALLATPALSADVPEGMFVPIEVGQPLPSIILPDLAGVKNDISRSEVEGGPLAIYFWSVFCSNCKEAIPDLIKINEEWKDLGLTIWAVNVDGKRFTNAVESFLAKAQLPFHVVFDSLHGEYLLAADPLGVDKTPTLYIADKNGIVVERQEITVNVESARKTLGSLK